MKLTKAKLQLQTLSETDLCTVLALLYVVLWEPKREASDWDVVETEKKERR